MSAKTDELLTQVLAELRDAVSLLRDVRSRLDAIEENTSSIDDDDDDDDDESSDDTT